MKHLILSHYDLDGISSVINVYNIIEDKSNFQYMLTGYTSLERRLKNLHKEEFDVLWVLDLNLAKEYIKYLPSDKKIIWIDHHNYEYDVNEETKHLKCTFIYDKNVCASLQTYKYLTSNGFNIPEKVKILSQITDIYDNWKKTETLWNKAYSLNDLFWEYDFEKFFAKFKNGLNLTEEDYDTITKINKDRHEYVKNTLQKYAINNEEHKILYILNPECKHTNHFTLLLYMNDIHFYIILKEATPELFSYSVRLYNPDLSLTVQELFSRVKEKGIKVIVSGGHERVGSITVPYEENEKFLETMNEILESV